jgi:hypothetical protein
MRDFFGEEILHLPLLPVLQTLFSTQTEGMAPAGGLEIDTI